MFFKTFFVGLLVLFIKQAVPCMPSGTTNSVSSGGDTYVCIVLSPLMWGYTTGSSTQVGKYLRIATKVKVDEFSRINVAKSWNSTDYSTDAVMSALSIGATTGSGLGVSVSSMGVTSYQKSYRLYDSVASKTFPMLMVLITVDKGKVIVSCFIFFSCYCRFFFLIEI